MPFRERVKRAFRRDSSSNSNSSTSDGSSTLTTTKTAESNTYAPGEAMPKPKYRGYVDPKHKETLESFSFGNAWRRKSGQSLYSPYGSKMPSRNNSVGADPRSLHAGKGRGESHFGKVTEDADDATDAANVGGTRNHSVDAKMAALHPYQDVTEQDTEAQSGAQETVAGHAQDHQPFTEADVTLALKKSASKRPGA